MLLSYIFFSLYNAWYLAWVLVTYENICVYNKMGKLKIKKGNIMH